MRRKLLERAEIKLRCPHGLGVQVGEGEDIDTGTQVSTEPGRLILFDGRGGNEHGAPRIRGDGGEFVTPRTTNEAHHVS